MSLMETPHWASVLASSAIPPGRSVTVTVNLTRRPSAARPRSRQRPSTVVSMLPPHKGITTLEKKLKIESMHLFSGIIPVLDPTDSFSI